ncbi:MAG: DUF2141 domain-containing protein [Bacteroidia bacterium]
MPKIILIIAFAYLFCSFSITSNNNITITVTNIKESDGHICVALFSAKEANAFPEDIDNLYQYKIVKAKSPAVTVMFNNLQQGHYAYSIVQDFNGNRYTDKNLVGYPTEPFGFSTNFKPLFSAPDFNDCDFFLDQNLAHTIKLIQ